MSLICTNCSIIKYAGDEQNGRISDLITKNIGLTWSCIACREIESEKRYKWRQKISWCFLDVRKEFSKLNEQFLTLEIQFLGLKLLSESPRRTISNNYVLILNLWGTHTSHEVHADTFFSPTDVPVETICSPSQEMETSKSLGQPIILDILSLEKKTYRLLFSYCLQGLSLVWRLK